MAQWRCRVCGFERYHRVAVLKKNGQRYETASFASSECSVMFLNDSTFNGLHLIAADVEAANGCRGAAAAETVTSWALSLGEPLSLRTHASQARRSWPGGNLRQTALCSVSRWIAVDVRELPLLDTQVAVQAVANAAAPSRCEQYLRHGLGRWVLSFGHAGDSTTRKRAIG